MKLPPLVLYRSSARSPPCSNANTRRCAACVSRVYLRYPSIAISLTPVPLSNVPPPPLRCDLVLLCATTYGADGTSALNPFADRVCSFARPPDDEDFEEMTAFSDTDEGEPPVAALGYRRVRRRRETVSRSVNHGTFIVQRLLESVSTMLSDRGR